MTISGSHCIAYWYYIIFVSYAELHFDRQAFFLLLCRRLYILSITVEHHSAYADNVIHCPSIVWRIISVDIDSDAATYGRLV